MEARCFSAIYRLFFTSSKDSAIHADEGTLIGVKVLVLIETLNGLVEENHNVVLIQPDNLPLEIL